MGEGVNHGGADAEAGERAGAGHEFDFGDVLPSLVIVVEFVFNKL